MGSLANNFLGHSALVYVKRKWQREWARDRENGSRVVVSVRQVIDVANLCSVQKLCCVVCGVSLAVYVLPSIKCQMATGSRHFCCSWLACMSFKYGCWQSFWVAANLIYDLSNCWRGAHIRLIFPYKLRNRQPEHCECNSKRANAPLYKTVARKPQPQARAASKYATQIASAIYARNIFASSRQISGISMSAQNLNKRPDKTDVANFSIFIISAPVCFACG